MQQVIDALRTNPEWLPNVLELLRKLGVQFGKGQKIETPPEGPGAEDEMKEGAASSSGMSEAPTSALAGKPASDPLAVVPRCYGTVGSLAPKFIAALLAAAEPIALSLAAQRQLTKPGSKYVLKDSLLELMEFISGCGPDDAIPPRNRVTGTCPSGRRASCTTTTAGAGRLETWPCQRCGRGMGTMSSRSRARP
jgi:hypothetical protein